MSVKKSAGHLRQANVRLLVCLFVLQLSLSGCCNCDQDSRPDGYREGQVDRPRYGAALLAPKAGVSGTFSIVAVDPNTGVCGAAVASKYPAVGKVVPYARAGVKGTSAGTGPR